MERGEKSLLCDPGSELRLLIGGERKGRAKKINGIGKKKEKKSSYVSPPQLVFERLVGVPSLAVVVPLQELRKDVVRARNWRVLVDNLRSNSGNNNRRLTKAINGGNDLSKQAVKKKAKTSGC